MKIDFALAVEKSTASVISAKNLQCGRFDEIVCSALSQNGVKALLCSEKGWYEAGKRIKDSLGGRLVSCFCVDENLPFEKKAVKLLNSVSGLDELVVIGNEQMALFALNYCLNSGARVIYIPLDFSFGSYLLAAVNRGGNDLLLLDENLLSQCGKNKLADGVRTVLTKKIFFVEMLVNQSIGGVILNNQAKNLLNEGQKSLKNYLQSGLVSDLAIAVILTSMGEYYSGAGNIVRAAADLLLRMQSLSLSGEREYLLYKMILRIYELYFSNDTGFTLSIPGVVVEEGEIKSLYSNDYSQPKICLPNFLYDLDAVNGFKEKCAQGGEILKEIKLQLSQIEGDTAILKKLYGGRKNSANRFSHRHL